MEGKAPSVDRKTRSDCNKPGNIPQRGGSLRPTQARPKLGNHPWQKDLDYQNNHSPNKWDHRSWKRQFAAFFPFSKFRFHYLKFQLTVERE